MIVNITKNNMKSKIENKKSTKKDNKKNVENKKTSLEEEHNNYIDAKSKDMDEKCCEKNEMKQNKHKSLKPTKYKDERLDCLSKIKTLIKYEERRNVIFGKNFNNDTMKEFNEKIYPKILLFFDSSDFKRINTETLNGFILVVKKIFREFEYDLLKSSYQIKGDNFELTNDFYVVADFSNMIE